MCDIECAWSCRRAARCRDACFVARRGMPAAAACCYAARRRARLRQRASAVAAIIIVVAPSPLQPPSRRWRRGALMPARAAPRCRHMRASSRASASAAPRYRHARYTRRHNDVRCFTCACGTPPPRRHATPAAALRRARERCCCYVALRSASASPPYGREGCFTTLRFLPISLLMFTRHMPRCCAARAAAQQCAMMSSTPRYMSGASHILTPHCHYCHYHA